MTPSPAPALPYRWTDALSPHCDVAAEGARVLRPDSPARLRRWTEALDRYVAAPASSLPPPPAEADDWVVALGAGVEPVAAELAGRLARRAARVETVDGFDGWHRRAAPRSVLLVAERMRLDFRSLASLQRCVGPAGTAFGVLTGVDLAALSFMAAKVALSRGRAPAGPAVVLDAGHGRVHDGREWRPLAAGDATRVEAETHRSLLFVAHGEGVHLFLDEAVLCGRVAPVERFRGAPVADGCSEGGCKRARDRGLPVVEVARIRAELMGFLSCNSFSVAGEMYPSDSSLVLAACDGHPAAVLGNPWATEFTPAELEVVVELVGSGTPPGEALAALNRVRARGDRWGSYLLLGDPLGTAGRGDAPPRVLRASVPPVEGGGAYEVRVAGSPAPTALVGGGAVLARGAPDAHLEWTDRSAELREAESWLRRIARRLAPAAAVEHALLRSNKTPDAEELAALSQLRQLRARIEHLLHDARSTTSHAREAERWAPRIPARIEAVRETVASWDTLFAAYASERLLGGGVVGDRILGALAGLAAPDETGRGAPCARCGVETVVEARESVDGTFRRILRECPLCGPLACHPEAGPRIELGVPGPIRRGGAARLPLRVEGLGADGTEGWLLVEVRDKTRAGSAEGREDRARLRDGVLPLEIPLAPEAGLDQHSVRAIWVGELEVLYARRVFVLTPDPETH